MITRRAKIVDWVWRIGMALFLLSSGALLSSFGIVEYRPVMWVVLAVGVFLLFASLVALANDFDD